MINAVGSSFSPNFGKKSKLERDISKAYSKFEGVVSDVADDNASMNRDDVVKGGIAGAAGFGVARANGALKGVRKGMDAVEITSKAVGSKSNKFLKHPVIKKLGPIGAIAATGLALAETANVFVNIAGDERRA